MDVVGILVFQMLFLSQTLNNFLLGYFRDAAPCQWRRVGVMVWLEMVVILEGGEC